MVAAPEYCHLGQEGYEPPAGALQSKPRSSFYKSNTCSPFLEIALMKSISLSNSFQQHLHTCCLHFAKLFSQSTCQILLLAYYCLSIKWSEWRGSNPRVLDPKSSRWPTIETLRKLLELEVRFELTRHLRAPDYKSGGINRALHIPALK